MIHLADIDLYVEEIEDGHTKENFDRVRFFFEQLIFTNFDGRLASLSVNEAVTNQALPHGLNFLPQDAWITKVTDSAVVTLKYDLFTPEDIVFTTDKACSFRVIIGSFRGENL